MAQQTITITCPACFNDFQVLDYETQTQLQIAEGNGGSQKTLQIAIMGHVDHDDCSATPA